MASGGPKFTVRLTPAAQKDLRRLDRQHEDQVIKAIDGLEDDPRPFNSEELAGRSKGLFRVRTGSYRVLYEIDYEQSIVTVTRAKHRRDAYRK